MNMHDKVDRVAAVAHEVARHLREVVCEWDAHQPACRVCRQVLVSSARDLRWASAVLDEVLGSFEELPTAQT